MRKWNYVDMETWEWNRDLIETKKIENYTVQVAQYKGEVQHEPRGAQHCRSLLETIENAVARKETWTSNPGWYEW